MSNPPALLGTPTPARRQRLDMKRDATPLFQVATVQAPPPPRPCTQAAGPLFALMTAPDAPDAAPLFHQDPEL